MDGEPEDGKSVPEEIREFCGLTTAHGFNQIYRRPNRARSYVWCSIILLVMGANLYHTYSIVQKYLDYRTQDMFKTKV